VGQRTGCAPGTSQKTGHLWVQLLESGLDPEKPLGSFKQGNNIIIICFGKMTRSAEWRRVGKRLHRRQWELK
jgi:hypothetical protein